MTRQTIQELHALLQKVRNLTIHFKSPHVRPRTRLPQLQVMDDAFANRGAGPLRHHQVVAWLNCATNTVRETKGKHWEPAQIEVQWSAPTPRCSSQKRRPPDEGELHVAANAAQPSCSYILGRANPGSGHHTSNPSACQDCI